MNQIVKNAPLTLALHSASRLYGAANPSFGYTITGLLNGDTMTVTPSTTATLSSPVGAYLKTATVSGADTANYTITVVNSTLQVEKVPLYISAASIATTHGQTPPPLPAYSLSGFVLGQDAASAGVTGAPVLSTSVTNTTPVGVYRIGVQVGTLSAANYYFDNFSNGEGNVVVRKAPLYISAASVETSYGQPPPQPTAYTLSGFVNGQNAVSAGVTGAPVLSTSVVPTTPVGCYRVGVVVGTLAAGNYYFDNFSNGEGNVCVARAPLYIQAANVTVTYGQTPPQPTAYNLIGFCNGETASGDRADGALSGAPALSTDVLAGFPTGNYLIGVQVGTLTAKNYYFVTTYSSMGKVEVTPAPLQVTASSLTMIQGGPVPMLTYMFSGFVNGDTASTAVHGAPSLSTTATSTSAPGSYPINIVTGTLYARNYYFNFVNGVMTVSP